jgi:hypothetical protein
MTPLFLLNGNKNINTLMRKYRSLMSVYKHERFFCFLSVNARKRSRLQERLRL